MNKIKYANFGKEWYNKRGTAFFVTFFIKFLFVIVISLRATRVILWLFWLKKSLLFKWQYSYTITA